MKNNKTQAVLTGWLKAAAILAVALALTASAFATSVPEASALTRPAQVVWSTTSSTISSVTLNWEKAKGAAGYTVYRLTNGKYTAVKSTKKLTFTDTKGIAPETSYKYYIKAYKLYNSKRIYGTRSLIKKITTPKAVVEVVYDPISSVKVTGSTVILSGNKTTLTAAVTGGTAPFTYKWYKNGTVISGAAGPEYVTDMLFASNNGDSYMCEVTGKDGKPVASIPITVTVFAIYIQPRTVVASWDIGTAGTHVPYALNNVNNDVIATLYSDGALEVTGTGYSAEMMDNQAFFIAPWHDIAYRSQVKSATIASTVKVIDMRGWFAECENLKSANIPDNVTSMWKTFFSCTSLETAPAIPNGVTNMMSTFQMCTALKTAPVLPASVSGLYATFSGCSSMTTGPDIPVNAADLQYTFSGCTALGGNIIVYSNVIDHYSNCFDHRTATSPSLMLFGYTPANNQLKVEGLAATGGATVAFGGMINPPPR